MRERLKTVANNVFLAADRVGVHVLPAHYYSSVSSRKDLRRTEGEWRRPITPLPFRWDLGDQLQWVRDNASFVNEVSIARLRAGGDAVGGFRYGPIEGQFLYSYLRASAPSRVLEIGSGSSTWISSIAVEANAAEGRTVSEILACDPYTADRVAGLPHVTAKSIGGLEIRREVEDLVAGDVLFIDSTHTVRTGSELAHLYLEIIPRLQPGVIVHIHDIYLPYVFAPNIYTSMFDWQETTLVAALLTGNDHLRVLASQSALAWERQAELTTIFPEYRPRRMDRGLTADPDDDGHFPSSLWLEIR